MHLLLPPSEAKAVGGRGRPLAARDDDHPLGPPRGCTLDALARLVAGAAAPAAAALLLPPGVAASALTANRAVRTSPTLPALRRYRGVVYDGLAYDTLDPAAQRVARRSVLIFSGLFGVVAGGERIPAYRVPAAATLPGLGSAASFWRPHLAAHLPGVLRRGLIIDLRSTDYAAMWRPGSELAARVLTVRIMSPTPSGRYGVISFTSKLAKGRLAAALIRRGAAGRSVAGPDDVAAAWGECGGDKADLDRSGRMDLYTA